MEFMASHGWLVVAPDHAGNTYYGTWAPWLTLIERRPRDIRETFDWLVAQSADSSSPLAGCVDEDAGYVVSGYSLGGYTAYAVGGGRVTGEMADTLADVADPRATQIVTHAGWDATGFIGTGAADIEIPVLTIGGERDATVGTDSLELHTHVRSVPRARATFFDGGHFTPAPIYCMAWGDGCGPAYVDPDVYAAITKTSILAFLEHNRGYVGAWEQIVEDPAVVEWELVRD